MTERSYVWDGLAPGDAGYAPYDKNEFNHYLTAALLSNPIDRRESDNFDDVGFVVPGYLNDLFPEALNEYAYGISIAPGAAVVKGYVYVQQVSESIPLEKPPTGWAKDIRLDTVVLRVDFDAQTVRLDVLQGTPTSSVLYAWDNRANIELHQIDCVEWCVPICYVLLDSSLDYVKETYVWDARQFLITNYDVNQWDRTNLIKNGEWLAFSSEAVAEPPEHWEVYGFLSASRTSWGATTGVGPYSRRAGVLTVQGGISQAIPVASGQKTYTLRIALDNVYISYLKVELRGKTYRETDTTTYLDKEYFGQDIDIHENITFEEDDIKELTLYLSSAGSPYTFSVGQVMLVPGYHPGPYRDMRELIMFNRQVTDVNWEGVTPGAGTYTVDLTTTFGGKILTGTRGVILRCILTDTNSAADPNSRIGIQGYAAPYNVFYGVVRVGSLVNGTGRQQPVMVPLMTRLYTTGGVVGWPSQFRVYVSSNTITLWVQVIGIIT